MIARQIGIVLCRVGAAFLTVQAFAGFGQLLPALNYGDEGPGYLVLFTGILMIGPGLVALLLWVYAERISTLADPIGPAEQQLPMTGVDIVRYGTALIGIYLLATGFNSAVFTEAGNLFRQDSGSQQLPVISHDYAYLWGRRVYYGARMLIGIALIMGRDGIAACIARARYAAR